MYPSLPIPSHSKAIFEWKHAFRTGKTSTSRRTAVRVTGTCLHYRRSIEGPLKSLKHLITVVLRGSRRRPQFAPIIFPVWANNVTAEVTETFDAKPADFRLIAGSARCNGRKYIKYKYTHYTVCIACKRCVSTHYLRDWIFRSKFSNTEFGDK